MVILNIENITFIYKIIAYLS